MSRTSLVALAFIVTELGCGQDATSPNQPPTRDPLQALLSVFESVSRTSGEGVVGAAGPYTPTVLVINGSGHPAANVRVRFAFVTDEPGAQAGSISTPDALTNAEGIATAGEWTLSTKAGPNILQATVAGARPLLFRADARPDTPASLGWLGQMEGEVALAGTAVQPPHVQVRDRFGNNVAGITVTFAITAGGGTLEGATMLTTNDGISALAWKLGPDIGANTLTASTAGLESIEFTIQAIEASAIYDFTIVDGAIGWDVASAFVAFAADGQFVSNTKYSDGWPWATTGTYVISGSTVVLTYDTGDEEWGSLVDGALVLDRWDNPCAPARQFHYYLRS